MGRATLGAKRAQLPFGDHLCYIVNVEDGEKTDFNDRNKKKPAFIWEIDVHLDRPADGFVKGWNKQKLWTPVAFTDMTREPKPKPQFVSGLNKLVRACGQVVPQTDAAVDEWDPESLCGLYFMMHLEEDQETGGRIRKLLKATPAHLKAAGAHPNVVQAAEETPDPFDKSEDDDEE